MKFPFDVVKSVLLLLAGMGFYPTIVFAVFEPGVGIGLEYTDNAGLTANNEEEDLIAVGYIGANIDWRSGPLTLGAVTSLAYEDYMEDTFSDQHYFDLSATAGWELLRDRVDLIAQNFFTQRLEDTVDRETPNNIENVNIFSIGPEVEMPVSSVQRLRLNTKYSDFYYENSDTDNQRYSLSLDWLYNTTAANVVGLGGSISKTNFDDEDLNPNFLINNVHAIGSGQISRSNYKLNLGYTYVNRDEFDNRSGFTGSLDWLYRLTGRSNARVYLASDLTDSSYSSLVSELDPGRGDIDNVQISGDIFRDSILRATITRRGSTLTSRLWAELRDLDYQESTQSQEVQNVGLRFTYQARALLSTSLYTQFRRIKRTDEDRTDKRYIVGGEIGYQLSRKLRTVLDIRYRDKSSDVENQEYSEFSGLINLVYGYGEVGRRGSRRNN